jgi:hypothetical protein
MVTEFEIMFKTAQPTKGTGKKLGGQFMCHEVGQNADTYLKVTT